MNSFADKVEILLVDGPVEAEIGTNLDQLRFCCLFPGDHTGRISRGNKEQEKHEGAEGKQDQC
ncbi:hypothetical protein D3C80_1741320 [compost metagenome]